VVRADYKPGSFFANPNWPVEYRTTSNDTTTPDRPGQGFSCFRAVGHWCQALIRRTAWAKRWFGLAPRQGRLGSLAMPSTAVSP